MKPINDKIYEVSSTKKEEKQPCEWDKSVVKLEDHRYENAVSPDSSPTYHREFFVYATVHAPPVDNNNEEFKSSPSVQIVPLSLSVDEVTGVEIDLDTIEDFEAKTINRKLALQASFREDVNAIQVIESEHVGGPSSENWDDVILENSGTGAQVGDKLEAKSTESGLAEAEDEPMFEEKNADIEMVNVDVSFK